MGRDEVNIEWVEPIVYLKMLRDTINLYNLMESRLLTLRDEQYRYLRGEVSTLVNSEDFKRSKLEEVELVNRVEVNGLFLDDLIDFLYTCESDEFKLLSAYLVGERYLTIEEVGEEVGLSYNETVNYLSKLAYDLAGIYKLQVNSKRAINKGVLGILRDEVKSAKNRGVRRIN